MNVPVTRAAEGLGRRAFTVAELHRMTEIGLLSEDDRIELIGGELVPMAAKGNRHESVKVALVNHWGRMRPDGYTVAPETGLTLDEYTYLEPDFIIFADPVRLATLTGPDVLLAVEVADSSLDYDLRRKPAIYAAHGVRELWVIDAAQRLVHVHREPGPAGFASVSVVGAADRVAPAAAPAAFTLALDDLPAV